MALGFSIMKTNLEQEPCPMLFKVHNWFIIETEEMIWFKKQIWILKYDSFWMASYEAKGALLYNILRPCGRKQIEETL